MTHLHSIRLRGFKTFAKPTELLFEPGVTVVIGPNGSGKSNIADAVLWVLGEQSPGNIRGRTMQDVIFTGPDGKRSSAVAEVSLVFDNDCGSLPLDCSQVEVSRRLVREGGSEYRLNGSACRLLDIQDLFAGLGLGREMHSVVSQGKVEAVLNSTPEARRALVEEAAGLGRFKKRRERTRTKLERTKQNLLRVADVEREVKSALRPLRQQVAAAERFAQATEEWAGVKARALLLTLSEVEASLGQVDGALGTLRRRQGEVDGELATLRRRRADDEELFASALKEREELSELYHRVQAEAERLDSRAMALRQRTARIQGELARAQRRRELAVGQLGSLADRVEETAARTSDETRLELVSALLAAKQTELEKALPLLREAVAAEDELRDQIFEAESARSRALQDRELLRRQLDEQERSQDELAGFMASATAAQQELEQQGERLTEQQAAMEDALTEASARAAQALESRDRARAEADKAVQDEKHLIELLSGLTSRRVVLSELLERRDGMSKAAQELLDLRRENRLLTEVLTVKPGYERALTAALGPLARAVVLAEDFGAAEALQKTGPLEVLWEDAAHVDPGDEGRSDLPVGLSELWDVVEGPQRLVSALKRLVPRTAVLEDETAGTAELARVVGAADWTLVSRRGEIMNGRLHAARRTEAGAEAQLAARNELEAVDSESVLLEAQRLEAASSAERAHALLTEAEEEYGAAQDEAQAVERSLMGARNENELVARRLEEARRQIQALQARADRETRIGDELSNERVRLQDVIAQREEALEEARATLLAVQGRVDTSRREVDRLEEKKTQAALLEVRLRERCRAQQAERERARRQRDTAAADADRYGRQVEMLRAYAPVLSAMLDAVERLSGHAHQAAEELAEKVEDARVLSDDAARTMRDGGGAEADLQREHDVLGTETAEAQVDRVRLDDRRAQLAAELAELRRRHMSPRALTREDVSGESLDSLEQAVQKAEQRRDRIGPVNPLAEQECAEMEERAGFLNEQRRDLEASIAQLQDVIAGLDEHINTAFMEIFEATRENFEAVIATIFPGAKGALSLSERKVKVDGEGSSADDEPRAEGEQEEIVPGIALSVKLPNKAPRSMSLLSGGEKAMTAIAFLFSLFLSRPCPFYILDEVEASLDDVNIRRFLSLIRRYRDRTQFIIITHQRQTMEIADTLYGVALESGGTSRVLSRRLDASKRERRSVDDQQHALVKEA